MFTVTRSGSTAAALNIVYTVGGSATNGADIDTLSGMVEIPAGQASATILVTPLDDAFEDDVPLRPQPAEGGRDVARVEAGDGLTGQADDLGFDRGLAGLRLRRRLRIELDRRRFDGRRGAAAAARHQQE